MNSLVRLSAQFRRPATRCLVSLTQRASEEQAPRIGFIGLGQMGRCMAGHLVKRGWAPLVYDINEEAAKTFDENNRVYKESQSLSQNPGFQIANSIRQIREQSSIIFTMLPMGFHVRDVYFGPEGLFANGDRTSMQSDSLYLVDCSTIGPEVTRELSSQVSRLGHTHIDAPVTGGVIGAQQATLNFLCGGRAEDINKLRALFLAMGQRVFHCGESGAGQIVKLCNNAILGATMIAVSEALHVANVAGLDLAKVSEIFGQGSAKSWVTDLYNPVPGIQAAAPASK